jgi:hypothetical protein
LYHGRDTRAYAVRSDDTDRYVAERVEHVKSGNAKPLDLRLSNGEVDSFSPEACWNLYIGAAGTIWALRHLSRKPDSLPDFSRVVPRLLEPNRNCVKGVGFDLRTAGLLTADTGILLVQAMLDGAETVVVQLGDAIDANRDNPAWEFMWGSPGTMLASLWLYEWTSQDIWAERFRRDAGLLWDKLEFVEEARCHLWVQNLYGHHAPHMGAVHGFAGNAFAAIRGWHLLSHSEQSRWADRLADTLRRTARWEDHCVNWPQSIGRHRPGRTAQLVQHCHGAPGIVNCFAGFPDQGIDDLLIGAGELIWRAGPPRKGPGLCHGTAGNGYAFLKLFRRSGDQRWLDRARGFANACYRAAPARYDEIWPTALPAVDWRSRPCDLSLQLHRRNGSLPDQGQLLRAVSSTACGPSAARTCSSCPGSQRASLRSSNPCVATYRSQTSVRSHRR